VATIRDKLDHINHNHIGWHGRDFGVEFIVLEVVVIVDRVAIPVQSRQSAVRFKKRKSLFGHLGPLERASRPKANRSATCA
jgi:hypothetical protein